MRRLSIMLEEPIYQYPEDKPLYYLLSIDDGDFVIERFRGSWREIMKKLDGGDFLLAHGETSYNKHCIWSGRHDSKNYRISRGPRIHDLASDDCRPARWDGVREWLGLPPEYSGEKIITMFEMDAFQRTMILTGMQNTRAVKLFEKVAAEFERYE